MDFATPFGNFGIGADFTGGFTGELFFSAAGDGCDCIDCLVTRAEGFSASFELSLPFCCLVLEAEIFFFLSACEVSSPRSSDRCLFLLAPA